MANAHPAPAPVILFDGHCLFCSGSVRWIHRRDPAMVFRFAAQQSPEGSSMLAAYGVSPAVDAAGGTLIVIDRSKGLSKGLVLTRSDGALFIARRLKRPWSWLGLFRIVPRPIRDALYDVIARNRFRFAARSEACFMPDDGLRSRFVIS